MIQLFATVFGAVMNAIYRVYKRRNTENKIAFISRQSHQPSVDFRYLIDEIKTHYPEYAVEVHCKMIPDGILGKLTYVPELFVQMKAMATSKVVVLDGYCILASMLTHKEELKIIQLWHALGAFKKFGKSILDREGGKSSAVAQAFKMHENYSLIAASGRKCVPAFAEAFGQPKEKFVPIGIPRMDYLTDPAQRKKNREAILSAYPALGNGKKNLLYVPTFRDTEAAQQALKNATDALIQAVDYTKYNLIIRHHVVDTNREEIFIDTPAQPLIGDAFTGMDFMAVADAVITDYSSVLYEALLCDLPLVLYCFDSEHYIDERGFYVDYYRDIPALYAKNAQELCDLLTGGNAVPAAATAQFRQDYVHKEYESVTAVWGQIIDELMRGAYDNRYNYEE